MKDLRIVFMGTPDFAVTILEKMLKEKLNVVGVVTAPDKPAGRGQKLMECAVKKFAKSKELLVLQPTNLKDEGFLDRLKRLNANLQVVVAFRMLPKAVWAMPAYGTFNLHASLLPDYRGAAPINWALINGEEKTGVTTFFIDEKIDTGEIILQEEVFITPKMNAGELHDQLMHKGADLVVKTIKNIEKGTVSTTKQPKTTSEKNAPKLFRENCKLNWALSAEQAHNKIRGLSPYPGAWCFMNTGKEQQETVKIFGSVPIKTNHNKLPGTMVQEKNTLKVFVKDGYIEILEMQLPGKRKMAVKDILNGYSFDTDSQML